MIPALQPKTRALSGLRAFAKFSLLNDPAQRWGMG